MSHIANLLATLRFDAGLTIQGAATLVGCNYGQWWEWENGRHVPRRLDDIIQAFDAHQHEKS